MKYDTILFDMDGTLFDTEKIYHEAWNRAGISDALYLQFIGRDRPHIFDLIQQNTDLDPQTVQAAKTKYTAEILAQSGVQMKPDLIETLTWLQGNGYHSCIATSSAKEVAENYLRLTNTGRFFDRIISGNTLPHGKPSPDIYLMAAREMNATPDQCVVVEDSFNGVRAGHAAGMKTVMIPDEIQPDAEMRQTADIILKTLGDLPAYLDSLNQI